MIRKRLVGIWRSFFPARPDEALDKDGRTESQRELAAELLRPARSTAELNRVRNNWPIV